MASKKILSQNEKEYYIGSMVRILHHIAQEKDQQDDAMGIQMNKEKISLAWELYDRPKLLQCLRTMTQDGLVTKIDRGWNWAYWKITDKGKEFIKQHEGALKYYGKLRA